MSRPNLQMRLSIRDNNLLLEFKPTRFRNCFLASPNFKIRKRHYLFGVLTRACSVMIYRSAFWNMIFGKFILRFCFAWCLFYGWKECFQRRKMRNEQSEKWNDFSKIRQGIEKKKRWKNLPHKREIPFAMPNKSNFAILSLNRICNKSKQIKGLRYETSNT